MLLERGKAVLWGNRELSSASRVLFVRAKTIHVV